MMLQPPVISLMTADRVPATPSVPPVEPLNLAVPDRPAIVPPAAQFDIVTADTAPSRAERLFAHVEDTQAASHAQIDRQLRQIASGHMTTSDLLRLQYEFGERNVKLTLYKSIADGFVQGMQTMVKG
ncbi:MAG TPA: hypothetical protein VGL08_04825 [Paraburkholderia sp.]|jgi:hypothetical protein